MTDVAEDVSLAEDFRKRTSESLLRLNRVWSQKNPVASNIHDCQRNIVYQVLNGHEKRPFDEWMLARFEEGRRQEKAVIDRLRALGYEIIDQDISGQLTIAVPEQDTPEFRRGEVLTGRIDGLIKWRKKWLPFEIKSINPAKFKGIKSIEDFKKTPLFRRYVRQMQMYLYGRAAERGVFILTDCMGHDLIIEVEFDIDQADWILKHVEAAARAIRAREYPERITYDSKQCDRCPFVQICLPDVVNKPPEFIDNEDVELMIDRHEELKRAIEEFEELKDNLRDFFKGTPKAIVGARWLVQMTTYQRTVYELTDEVEAKISDMKKPFMKKADSHRMLIQKLNEAAASPDAAAGGAAPSA